MSIAGTEPRVARRVGVAVDRTHRRDQLELIENVVAADVARVENELDARQRRVHVGPHEAVRVGDQPDDVRVRRRSFRRRSPPHRGTSACGTPR